MTAPSDDEFANFLEFGMPFADLGTGQQRQQSLPPRSLPPSSMPPSSSAAAGQDQLVRMDTDPSSSSTSSFEFHSGSNQDAVSQGTTAAYTTAAAMTPGFYAQEQPPQFKPPPPRQQPQDLSHAPNAHYPIPNGQTVIPPTPNSIELHGGAARYPQRVDEHHDMYSRMNDEQVGSKILLSPNRSREHKLMHDSLCATQAYYTPLISPAMTPLETQFRLPEFTIPGEYFTPLTSPALEAQNAHANNAYPYPQGGQVSEMGFTQSPVDSALPGSSTPSSPGLIRKHRRGPSTTNRFSSRAKKQQSPSVRPQARKSLLNVNSDEVFNGLSQENHHPPGSKPQANGVVSGLRFGSNESSQDSVSPEPLSEPLMPPPAIPHRSPSIAPQQAAQSSSNEPATPAMLMRIQRSQQQGHNSTGQFTGQAKLVPDTVSRDDVMTDIILPEAAAAPAATQSAGPRPKMTRIDTAVPTAVPTPAASTNTTPALEPKSAPVVNRNQPPSIAPSPRSLAMPSPSGPVAKKSDTPKLGPSSKKRPSLSSAQPSPQLRPKISPNIQPLVPRGEGTIFPPNLSVGLLHQLTKLVSTGVSNETSALYLASKSNYQHILDGTLLPGVSYPETLAENLSSKRTNHKLAEQGRRNRINHALKEIETLIPVEFAEMRTAKEAAACNVKPSEKEKEKAGNQAISKASTVEMAIDYIKALQQELRTTKTKLVDAESRLDGVSGQEVGKDGQTQPSELNKESGSTEDGTADVTTQSNAS